jgi:predicted nucleic acid-binding protein
MIVLDTNVISALMRASENRSVVAWLDGQPWSSIWTTSISIMEIRYGFLIMQASRRRDARVVEFERVMTDGIQDRILAFHSDSAEQAAMLMTARRRAGRPIELRDTMIAGIALAHRATLATRNVRHFDDLSVPVVDPWSA